MNYIFAAILGYLIGSFPTAYVITKKVYGFDIREKGSGNVGTLNSYEVTNSIKIGIIVLIIDFLKGFGATFLSRTLFGDTFSIISTSLFFAVLSHCFSPWLNFKGGRGLATAAGGSILISPIILFLWLLLWLIMYFLRKDIHLSNIIATLMIIFAVVFNGYSINNFTIPNSENVLIFKIIISSIMVIILIKHWTPFKEYLSNQKGRKFKK